MKVIKRIKTLESECLKVKSGCSGDTIFSAKGVMFIAYKMEELIKTMKANTIEVKGNAKYKRIFWRFYFKQ